MSVYLFWLMLYEYENKGENIENKYVKETSYKFLLLSKDYKI